MKAAAVLKHVTEFYLTSGDFNGISVSQLILATPLDEDRLVSVLRSLIEEGKIGLQFSDANVNIHVLRLGHEEKETQIAKLSRLGELQACVYPLPEHLKAVVDRAKYEGVPYTLALALGEPQLSFRVFDLSVLEFYRNDPRYEYSNDDVRGKISITSEYYESERMLDRDKVLLQSFGICYDDDYNRAVAVYLRYLADLSPEHQQIWKAKELDGNYKLHPDYYRNTIIGDWGEGISIFNAFIEELHIINEMCDLMGRPHLFRNDFKNGTRPRNFSFLIRPTLREYNSFVLTLDQMLSDNINKDFFGDNVPDEEEIQRKDGRIEVRAIGTLRMLDSWIRKYFRPEDWTPVDDMIAAFKNVRRQRQKPAHKIQEDIFDMEHFHRQRSLMIEVYEAVRTLRLIFANHPRVRFASNVVPTYLQDATIWTY